VNISFVENVSMLSTDNAEKVFTGKWKNTNFTHFSLPDSPYSTYQYSNIKERKEISLSVANRPTSSGHVGLLTKDMAP